MIKLCLVLYLFDCDSATNLIDAMWLMLKEGITGFKSENC
jgi:hypothetical protein